MHHANVFITVFGLDSYPQNSSEKWHRLKWTRSMEKNGAGDQKNSKGRLPKQAQGNPILTYWQLPPTNKHKSLPNQDAQVWDNQNTSFVRIKQQHNHGNNNNNSLRDRRNSTAPGGLVGSPKWLIVRTNLTRFRSFSVLCGYEKREFGKILSRQVDLFTREMEIKCERFIISWAELSKIWDCSK